MNFHTDVSPTLSKTNRHRSFWLQEALTGVVLEPPLQGSEKADIAIIGGGYVGLWTAITIKTREPNCDVVILEQDICGGGASGRNGGIVLSWWQKLHVLAKICGKEEAVRIAQSSEDAIDELNMFCNTHEINAHFLRRGWLWTATTQAQMGAWETAIGFLERLGISAFQRLEPEEVAARTGSRNHHGGVFYAKAATVQPAALALGLRKVALNLGVRIYENSRVQSFSRSRPALIKTSDGMLASEKVIIANNSWAAGIRELQSMLLIISSDMVVTTPIPKRIKEIGWVGGESITDSQIMGDYYRTTHDGRIAFGKDGWGLAFRGGISNSFNRNTRRAAATIADFRRYYPMLSDIAIDCDWSGPMDMTSSNLPTFGHLGNTKNIIYGVGWSGNGIGPSVLGGKILASLALDIDNEWSSSPFVGRTDRLFLPEPARFVSAYIARIAVARKELAEAQDRIPPNAADQLAKLVPIV